MIYIFQTKTKKTEILNQKNTERVRPLGWSEAVLEVAVRWLMRQCGRIETECRHKSMELVHKLTPCIAGKETREYFQLKLQCEGDSYFLARFEGSVEKRDLFKNSLVNFKTLPELSNANMSNEEAGSTNSEDSSHYQLSYVLTWLSMLVAPLDCYSWIFGERLMQPSALLGPTSKTCIWTSLSYFIENIVNYDLVNLIKRIYNKNNSQV